LTAPGTVERLILWVPVDQPGHDTCVLRREAQGWSLKGFTSWKEDDVVSDLRYVVECDEGWRTQAARVEGTFGEEQVALTITALPDGGWAHSGGRGLADPDCPDVDLSFTPATNLLAIRRLGLAVGEEAQAPAAWLRWPERSLERLEQRYRRIARDRYEYESPGNGYRGELEVSDVGFVRRYPGLWECGGEWDSAGHRLF
jgi:hypothetical protein